MSSIDGALDDPCWLAAPATDSFVDIVGPSGPLPWHSTHVKMVWDDEHLYIGADLKDPRLFAFQDLHDSIIFNDNDFEVFIDPDGDNMAYYEIEVNALSQVWDLLLIRPYRNGGPPVMNWETIPPAVPTATSGPTGWRPLRHGVRVSPRGGLNCRGGSRGWTVELALPWSLLQQAANRRVPPHAGDQWRINFSRVHWNVTWAQEQQRYIKDPADQPGYNWVWSPQWQVQMHQPETWGCVEFDDSPVHQAAAAVAAGAPAQEPAPDATWPARALLMDVFYAQTMCWQAKGRFCRSLQECGELVDLSDVPDTSVTIETTRVSFVASTRVGLSDGSCTLVMVDQLSRLTQTPITQEGGFVSFNPFEGSSTHQQHLELDSAAAGSPGQCQQQEVL